MHVGKARILIVEDEAIIAQDIRGTLTKLGYEVVGATDEGQEAIRLAAELKPDLVLMDVRLKGPINGLEAGRLIEESVGSVVTYLTASPDGSRMTHSVEKPFSQASLALAIQRALGK